MTPAPGSRRAFSLIELLCVMAIIAVLASLTLGAAGRAYRKVRAFAGTSDNAVHLDELRSRVAAYSQKSPNHPSHSLDELIQLAGISSRCSRYLHSKEVSYLPFSGKDEDAKVVLLITPSEPKAESTAYTKLWITTPPYYEGP